MAAPPLVPTAEPNEATHIADFVRLASFEATRPSDAEIAAFAAAAAARRHAQSASAPWPTRLPAEQVETRGGPRPVVSDGALHLAARNFANAIALDDHLARLVEIGVRRLLVIGGDRDTAAGSFHHAIEVIESGLPQNRGIREIGIAGYPEGHPRVAATELDALAAKIECGAAATGSCTSSRTCLAPEPVLAFVARLRDMGIEQPVRVGVAGPASVATLLRFAAICGVAASARALAHNAGLAKHLLAANAPDAIIRSLAAARVTRALGDVAPHFFTFGGSRRDLPLAAAVAAGRVTLDRSGGFRVEGP